MKKALRGSGDMLPKKIFGNLHTVVAILGKFCLYKFFAPISECFTKYDAFCSYSFDYVCLGREVSCYQKGSKL